MAIVLILNNKLHRACTAEIIDFLSARNAIGPKHVENVATQQA